MKWCLKAESYWADGSDSLLAIWCKLLFLFDLRLFCCAVFWRVAAVLSRQI